MSDNPVGDIESKIVEQANYHADMMRLQRLQLLRGDVTSVLDADIDATTKRLTAASSSNTDRVSRRHTAEQDSETQVGTASGDAPAHAGSSS